MKPERMSHEALTRAASEHEEALHRLRKSIGLIGFCLPFALLIGVLFFGVPMQNSISEFFFTGLRDVFVLALAGVGVFLISYYGHPPDADEWLTDWGVSTTAGVTALLVALVPTECAGACYFPLNLVDRLLASDMLQSMLHFGAAGVFLTCLALFCLRLFVKTDDPDPPPDKVLRNRIYRACGWTILAMVAALLVFKLLIPALGQAWDGAWHFTFWVESIAVWAFGLSWMIKGEAMRNAAPRILYGGAAQ